MTCPTATPKASFHAEYRLIPDQELREVERRVLGSDFGSAGFTTREQADALLTALDLGPGDRLLDVGAGRGWPGLYLASRSGCRLVSVDLPLAGLAQARSRAQEEALANRSWQVSGDGRFLPFRPQSFDAIVHTDVLC